MDSLDDLFKTVRREQRVLKRLEKLRKNPVQTRIDDSRKIASYHDLSLWTKASLITLVHADSGEILGVFQEYLHKTAGRRLVRLPDNPSTTRTEFVRGAHWVTANPTLPPAEDSPQEVERIHRRFEELMASFL